MSNTLLEIIILDFHDLGEAQKCDWIALHIKCFGTSELVAGKIMQKYVLNESTFCLVYLKQKLVAAYSGLRIKFKGRDRIFLSTDTMSNGEVAGASIIAANALYRHLAKRGFKVVCGYPNKNIEGLRENKLGWMYSTCLDLYLMPSFCLPGDKQADITIKRPAAGFFGKDLPFVALGRFKKPLAICRLELATTRPSRYAINISRLLGIGRKRFYYRKLDELYDDEQFSIGDVSLTIDSIDVP